jgi:hypothetical protein
MRALHSASFALLGFWLLGAGCVADVGDAVPDPDLEEEYVESYTGEPVARWNQNGFSALTRGPDVRFQVRGMAMMHIAMHDAANLVRGKYKGYAVTTAKAVDTGADPALAAAAAAHDVLVALRPDLRSQIDGWLQTDLARVTNSKHRDRSLMIGASAAKAIIALRTGDSCCSDTAFVPGTAPGDYQYTPPFTFVYASGWGNMRPFSLSSGDQFRPAGPPDLSSAEWAADYGEAQAYGSSTSTVRTSQQTYLARFWIDGTPEIYCRMARNLIAERNADLWDSARALALAFIAGNDAAISVWDAKYEYAFWRPITAIRAGDTDGNDATLADTAWSPLALTPPHPEYSSAHAATAAAVADALAEVFGDVSVHATSNIVPGEVSWGSLTESAGQCAESRVWVGYHFRSAIEDGLAQGFDVGQWVVDHTGLNRL